MGRDDPVIDLPGVLPAIEGKTTCASWKLDHALWVWSSARSPNLRQEAHQKRNEPASFSGRGTSHCFSMFKSLTTKVGGFRRSSLDTRVSIKMYVFQRMPDGLIKSC